MMALSVALAPMASKGMESFVKGTLALKDHAIQELVAMMLNQHHTSDVDHVQLGTGETVLPVSLLHVSKGPLHAFKYSNNSHIRN